MDSPGLIVSVSALREAVRKRVAATSLRAVEAATGVSFTALRNFLAGGSPHSANRKKLTAWYLAGGADVEPEDALRALGMLVSGLPPSHRTQALRDLLLQAEKSYTAAGIPQPAWLEEARAAIDTAD